MNFALSYDYFFNSIGIFPIVSYYGDVKVRNSLFHLLTGNQGRQKEQFYNAPVLLFSTLTA